MRRQETDTGVVDTRYQPAASALPQGMAESSPRKISKRPADDARPPGLERGEAVVGMGFFPEEVGLPAGWTWEENRVTR